MNQSIIEFCIRLFTKGLSGIFILCISATSLFSQSTLTNIWENGNPVNSAANVRVAIPNQQLRSGVSVNNPFPSGTIIETPPNTVLRFTSVNGNIADLPGNSKIRLSASPSGESYTTFFGKAFFHVLRQVGFFNVSDSNGKVTGASRSTAYSIDVTKDVVTFNTTEGAIALFQKIPVKVNQAAMDNSPNQNRELSTFSNQYQDQNSGAFAININNMSPKVFNSFADAIAASAYNIQVLRQNGNLQQVADESSFLGYLYLDANQPSNAIPHLQYALNSYATIDPYDPYISELYLDLAEAYIDAGDTGIRSRR